MTMMESLQQLNQSGAGNAGSSALGALITGVLGGTQNTGGSGTQGFDQSQLPFFLQSLQRSDAASKGLRKNILGLSGNRRSSLTGDLDRQLQAVRGIGNQEISDVNRLYDARRNAAGQKAASSGLYNTTVKSGMQALADRERNLALGQARERQQGVLGGILGQRAQVRDRAASDEMQLLSNLGFQDYGLRTLLPKAAASSRVSTARSQQKQKSLLERLFG